MTFLSTLGYRLYLRIPQAFVQPLLKAFLGTLLAVAGILPAPAFAFELELPETLDEILVSYDAAETVEETTMSYSSGVAIARPSTVTELGDWPQVRPRAARRAVSVPAPVHALADGETILVLEGEASYYSRAGCLGCNPLRIMANGQPLDDAALTMAIGANNGHLVGRVAKVTNLVTDQSILVRITDTGGFYQAHYGNRVADLTVATKQAIGIRGGVGQVRVEVY